jgi:hypothetical protein
MNLRGYLGLKLSNNKWVIASFHKRSKERGRKGTDLFVFDAD